MPTLAFIHYFGWKGLNILHISVPILHGYWFISSHSVLRNYIFIRKWLIDTFGLLWEKSSYCIFDVINDVVLVIIILDFLIYVNNFILNVIHDIVRNTWQWYPQLLKNCSNKSFFCTGFVISTLSLERHLAIMAIMAWSDMAINMVMFGIY